jgi:hypothetical protein
MADLSPELAAQLQALESSYAEKPGRYYVPYAGLLREAGQPERAEEILRTNLKHFPGLSAHVLLGRCLADRGAHPEAANEFHYVLSLDAQNLIALRTLAEMAAADGRVEEARRWYGELLSVDPMNADARQAVGRLAGTGADASTADQPTGSGDAWGGAAEGAPAAGGAAAAEEEGELEWGNLELGGSPSSPAEPAPAAEFDAFEFGEVELGAAPDGGGEARPDEPGTAVDGGFSLLDFGSEAEAEDGPVPEPVPAEEEEPEVVTETMAELYASQGLADRAAEVYRELIQRRGEEPGLVGRLAELEGATPAPTPEPSPPDWLRQVDEASTPAAGELPSLGQEPSLPGLDFGRVEEEPGSEADVEDAFAASVSAGFGEEAASAAADDRAEWEAPEVAEGDATAGFDLVVIDESVELDGDAHPPATAEAAAELSADWAAAAAPLEEPESEVEEEADLRLEVELESAGRTLRGYFDALLGWQPAGAPDAAPGTPEPVADADAVEAEPWAAAAADEAATPAATEPEEPLPWELPADGPAGEPEPEPEPAAASGPGFSFEEFFSPEPEPEPESPPAPPAAAAEAPPAAPGGTEGAGAPPAGGEEDEDLESFQAWLQSLKR